jgi:hypothetical protein
VSKTVNCLNLIDQNADYGNGSRRRCPRRSRADARNTAADNAHAAVIMLRLGSTLAELGRYARRERV